MGTRNLVTVFKDGEFKVAQYCQWDGDPTGQGEDLRAFLVAADIDKLRNQVDKVTWAEDGYIESKLKELLGRSDGFMDMDEAQKFNDTFPEWSRDTGAKILSIIMERDDVKLVNSLEFVKDNLFCEYAYVVDLDKDILCVYGGGSHDVGESHFGNAIALNSKFTFEGLPTTSKEWASIFEERE